MSGPSASAVQAGGQAGSVAEEGQLLPAPAQDPGSSVSFFAAKAAIAKAFQPQRAPLNQHSRDKPCLICDKLYLSSCDVEANKVLLEANGITLRPLDIRGATLF